jgi:PleD family two-component response regulator
MVPLVVNITASFGVSTFNPHTDDADKLIQAADKLLYTRDL